MSKRTGNYSDGVQEYWESLPSARPRFGVRRFCAALVPPAGSREKRHRTGALQNLRTRRALHHPAAVSLDSRAFWLMRGPLDRRHKGTPHPGPLPFGRVEGEASSGFGVAHGEDYSVC